MSRLPDGVGERAEKAVQDLVSLLQDPHPQDVLVTCVALVEGYVDESLAHALGFLYAVDRSLLTEHMVRMQLRSAAQSWGDRRELLKLLEAHVDGDARGRFDVLVEARNAVVHGRGALSPNQHAMSLTKRTGLEARLSSIHLSLGTGRLQYGTKAVKDFVNISREYVLAVDVALAFRT